MKLTARMPSIVSSSTSSNPGRTWYGYQDPGKSVATHNRPGKPEKTSWDKLQQVRPHREEPLLDGNVQSVRYGEIIHDRSGQPDSVNYQEEAELETFVMGSDAEEFVNEVKDQVRKKTEKNVDIEIGGRTRRDQQCGFSSSWWDWQDSWWYSSFEHHHDDGPSTDRSGKPDGW